MATTILITAEFERWYGELTIDEQESIRPKVKMLEESGATLGYPHSTKIHGSRFREMRELRIQHAGNPYRILYAFDPVRQAVLLMGGEKTGDDRWYEKAIRLADTLFDDYLRGL
jgi:hypothetical protein